ncbi:hypothetical protein CEUSTIGMA_g205.t1 [Chlamydomonas eustigma]|uniref:EF-hand domain-containing protein n=1 Tax=Chlamydomonas eustigma TaxID=1157962 RepID=A0A250WPX5_9CHLO|nr:hypothetical protein CEUSTIGMA_g205.t1 [Chlamydomonas eustigma]|eukprot:GAX72749.1 hypothetical protein CEUSTIGMA_g205.t1 [Chlamydomonas eustigma]
MSQYGQAPPYGYHQAPQYTQIGQTQQYQHAYQGQQYAPAPVAPQNTNPYQQAPQYGAPNPQYSAAQPHQQLQQSYEAFPISNYQSTTTSATDPAVIEAWFEEIDMDRSGSITAKELRTALAMGNRQYSLSDADQMVRAFDTSETRTLRKRDFVELYEYIDRVRDTFERFDSNKRGALNLDQLVLALKNTGFDLDTPVVTALFKRHDPDNSNCLATEEFLRLNLFLKSCQRTFSAFDSQKSGRVSMDLYQFVYAVSHI